MSKMVTILAATTSLYLIAQLYPVGAAPKGPTTTDGVIVLDRKEVTAAQRKANEVGKVQYFYYQASPDGVKRQEMQSPAKSDRPTPSTPRATPATSGTKSSNLQ